MTPTTATPFIGCRSNGWLYRDTDVTARLATIRNMNPQSLNAALNLRDLQPTVIEAIHRRMIRLAKACPHGYRHRCTLPAREMCRNCQPGMRCEAATVLKLHPEIQERKPQ